MFIIYLIYKDYCGLISISLIKVSQYYFNFVGLKACFKYQSVMFFDYRFIFNFYSKFLFYSNY